MSDDIDQIISNHEKRKSDEELSHSKVSSESDARRAKAIEILKGAVIPECEKFRAELDQRSIPNGMSLDLEQLCPNVAVRISSPDKSETVELRISHEPHLQGLVFRLEVKITTSSRYTDKKNDPTQSFEQVSAEFVREQLIRALELALS